MEKSGLIIASVFLIALIFVGSVNFASANWFTDFWEKITGQNIINGNSITGNVVNLGDGLVAHYKFDGDVNDAAGLYYGILNGVTFDTGKINQAAFFDGNGYINLPNTTGLISGFTGLTYSAWVYYTGGGYQPAILCSRYRGSIVNFNCFIIDNTNSKPYAYVKGDNQSAVVSSSTSIQQNAWNHVVLTWSSGSTAKIYVNGVFSGESTTNYSFVTNNKNLFVVGYDAIGADRKFRGKIDDLRIYSRALSNEEISVLYNSVPNVTCVDDCSSGSKQCSGNGYQTCGNYDADSCLDWSNVTLCSAGTSCSNGACVVVPANNTCTDSDGGLNYYNKGKLYDNRSLYPSLPIAEDSCYTNKILYEQYCTPNPDEEMIGGRIGYGVFVYSCPNGCSNGVCIGTPPAQRTDAKCNDTDGGINYNSFGITTVADYSNFDSCQSGKIWEGYCSEDGYGIYTKVNQCPKGCLNGACVATPANNTCVDSDGGINYSVKGRAWGMYNGSFINVTDGACGTNITNPESFSENGIGPYIGELYCSNNELKVNYSTCPNGCSNGACLTEPPEPSQVCSDLISKVKNPADFVYDGIGYTLEKNSVHEGVFVIDNREETAKEYAANWYTNYNEKYNSISYSLVVFDNEEISLDNWLEERTSYQVCQTRDYYIGEGATQKVYICNWDVMNNQQSLDSYQTKNREIIWVKDNVLVQIYTYMGERLTDEEISKIAETRVNEFLNSLQDNRESYVDWTDFEVEYPLNNQIENSLLQCPSDVEGESSSWSCKTEPTICPEYGYQKRTCRSWNEQIGSFETRTTQISCSPGICSGCYTPRWFDSSDNKCIPYGFRFVLESGDKERISETDIINQVIQQNGFDASFEIRPDGTAFAKVNSDIDLTNITDGEIASFTFYIDGEPYAGKAGESLVIYPGIHQIDVNYFDSFGNKVYADATSMEVSNIIYSEDPAKRYLELVSRYDYPAYCDIDGWVKHQKTKDYEGNWAKCQNSYECESNLCSGGKCVEINDILDENNAFKGVFVRVVCKLANLFDLEEYNQCIYDYLGEVVPSEPSGGGGGGSVSADEPPAMPE
jgi:hypothetical protein